MALLTQSKFASVVQKDLSEHFAASFGEFQSMIPALFDVKTPDQAIVNERLIGDLSAVPIFDGEIFYDDSKQSFGKTVEEIEYAMGLKVTKKLRRNDLFGVVRDQVAQLAIRVRAKRESIAAEIFNGGFTTTTTADGLSLFNGAHISDQGAASQSNSGVSPFSPAAVEATRQLIIKWKTNNGNIMHHFPDLLLVGTDNEEKAFELIKSKGKVDTSLNNENFHKGRYKLAVWHNWLTNPGDWFFIVTPQMRRFLKFYEWNPVEFFMSGEFDTLVSKHAAYMSVNTSAPDWRWAFGHDVP